MTDKSKAPRFRGLDFLMRFAQGRWSEDRIIEGVNNTANYRAVPYGRSQVYVDSENETIEEYWKKYSGIEKHGKRPDILVFRKAIFDRIKDQLSQDPTLMDEDEWRPLVAQSVCGIEAENSLWRALKMPDKDLKLPLPRKSNIIAPNVWVKEEDVARLLEWQRVYEKPIYVVQVFFDLAYCAQLQRIVGMIQEIKKCKDEHQKNALMRKLGLLTSIQKYTDSRTGISEEKEVHRLHPASATLFGTVSEEPSLQPKVLESKNGKLMPYVHFSGGTVVLTKEILDEWDKL